LRSGHRIEQFETQRQRKDGKVIYVSLAISPIHDHNGRMVGASTVARDITAQKQAEESLAQSQAQLKGIIDSAMDAVITVDQHQRILMFNPAAEKMFGYAGGEIKGETLERLIPLRFRADHEQHVRRFGATGTTSRAMGALGALNGLRKDGREFPIEASISQVEIEGKKLFTAIIRDVTDRVRTEESLRQSEAQIKSIIDSAMDALVTVDSQQQIVMFNPAAEKMFRCSASAALGSPLERFIPQRFRAAHAQHVRGFGETGTTSWGMGTRGILKGLRADGEEFPIEASISQTISSEKKLYTAIVRDVTERERSEQQLRETQEQLRLFVEYAPAAIAMLDYNMNYVAASSRWMADYGIQGGKIIGRNHYEVFPDIPDAWREIHRRCLAGEVARNEADLWTRSDGAAEWVRWEVRPWRKSNGVIGGLIIFSEVITERKRSEEALQLAQSRLLSALEGGRMGTWVWDIGSNQVVWDEAMSSLFGRTAEDLTGGSIEPFFSWLHPQDRERTRAALENAVREGSTYDAEYRLFRPDQSMVWVAARGRVENDAQGRAFRMTGVCIDITDRKKIEEQLLQAQKMESLGTLAGGIAHDFNNILLAIGGNAHLAIEELPPEHPAQTSLREIAKAGTRATNLVRQILSFSRRQAPDRKPVKVQPVVEEALALLRATLPARIEIRSTFATDLPSILADSTQLHQVVMNLATNAVRAMGEQPGALEVMVKPVTITPDFAAPNIKLKAGEYVRLSISDTGCGMDAAILERIFDPFFTTQAPGPGTGLGLSVVHGIMKDHEGAISVYSEPGKGTIFHLYFPAISEGAETAKAPVAPRHGRGQRVLYVDDEEALVLLATRSLGRLGYQVAGETDPVRALQLFRKNPAQFDAVVTDLSMPGMSGSELARQMMEVRPGIPVVMMSGYLRPEDEEEARRMGVRDLILKPDTIEDLAQSLDRLFSAISAEPHGVPKPLTTK
jgi:PAS domain S-box-containing protein